MKKTPVAKKAPTRKKRVRRATASAEPTGEVLRGLQLLAHERSERWVGDPSRLAAQRALQAVRAWSAAQEGMGPEQVREAALTTMIWLCGCYGLPVIREIKEDFRHE